MSGRAERRPAAKDGPVKVRRRDALGLVDGPCLLRPCHSVEIERRY